MKILIIASTFPPEGGGLQNKMFFLLKQWCRDGHSVVVLTPVHGRENDLYKRVHVPLNGHYLYKAYLLSRKIRQVVNEYAIDIIYCLSWSPEGVAVLLSGFGKKIKWAVTVSGFDVIDGLKSPQTRFLIRQVFRQTTKIYPPGIFLNSKVQSTGDFFDKTVIIPHGVDIKMFSPDISGNSIRKKYALENNLVIMTLSRLHPIKGIDLVIDAFSNVVKQVENARLLIVGTGEDENELKEKVRKLQIGEKVVFTGWVSHQESPGYYAACDVFVMSGRNYLGREEGQPFSSLEASACGKPVVGLAVGGIPEVVIDNYNGFLVNPKSTEELIQKLEYLLFHPEERKRLGENGVSFVRNSCDISKNARRMLEDLLSADEPE
ncbi:MAG: glycosyltransferase family 4 protein [Candidatus Omnitrophota bacterium]